MAGLGTIKRIHIAPEQGAPPQRVKAVEAVAQQGLRGDRYFRGEGTFANREGCDVTFIEIETLEAVERDYGISLDPGVHRRNITTSGVSLNHLVNKQFYAGEALCEGIELCEPCAYLEQHLEKKGTQKALVHRGGLRATILEGGKITSGSNIRPI